MSDFAKPQTDAFGNRVYVVGTRDGRNPDRPVIPAPAGSSATLLERHEQAENPHPQYLRQADLPGLSNLTGLLTGKQDRDVLLDAISALEAAANKLICFTGDSTLTLSDLSAFARTLLGAIDAQAFKAGLSLGTLASVVYGLFSTPVTPAYRTF